MRVKRVFDLVVAICVLAVSSPVWLVVAILIKATSRGGVLHRAVRTGRGGASFTLIKFRTMRAGGETGIGVTASGDSRITPVGRALRRFKIDELPQLINVVRGEMSLVGPRPEDPRYVAGYTDHERQVLSVRPGITSPASIAFRHEEKILAAHGGDHVAFYRDHVLPEKLAIDLAWLERRTFWVDLGVLLKTALAILTRRD